jgi:hypothetical protein
MSRYRLSRESLGRIIVVVSVLQLKNLRASKPIGKKTAKGKVQGEEFGGKGGEVHCSVPAFQRSFLLIRFTLPCSKHADRCAYPYIHPIPSHRPHLGRTQLGFDDAVFVLLEQRTPCALSAYPPPVSSLRGHGVPRHVADALFWGCAQHSESPPAVRGCGGWRSSCLSCGAGLARLMRSGGPGAGEGR